MCMNNQNYLIDAINEVITWDLPDELFHVAISDQARLLAGFAAEDGWAEDVSIN